MARLNRNPAAEGEGGDNRLPSPTTATDLISLPEVPADLINYLIKVFPNTLPPEGSPYSALDRAWGKQEVVQHLIWLKEQIEEENHVLRRRINSSPSAGPGSPAAASR